MSTNESEGLKGQSGKENSQAKHTPGPWLRPKYVNSENESLQIVAENPFGEGEWLIGHVFSWGGDGHQQAEANANLFAAAPDLLKACYEMRAMLRDLLYRHLDDAAAVTKALIQKKIYKADAAIAKATG